MPDKALNRRAALSFLGGALTGAAIDNGLSLIVKPDIPLQAQLPKAEICYLEDVEGKFEAGINQYAQLPRRIIDHKITKKRAQKESSIGSTLSREAYIAKTVDASTVLPDYLKSLICYIPYEESKFNTTARSRSNPPAVGTWQFMPGTAANRGMVGPHIMVNDQSDRRTDFELSTKAAVKYFEYIYLLLSKDPNYLVLKKRYQLDDNGFLSLTVLHAYNAGEGHMQRAFQIIAHEPSIRADIDSCGAKGSLGLYLYLTEEYIKHFKKWQKSRPYFYKESAAYAYKVLAFRKLDNPEVHKAFQKTIARSSEAVPPPREKSVREVNSGVRAAIGSFGAIVGWGTMQHTMEKIGLSREKPFDRREFLIGATVATGGAIGALTSKYSHDLLKKSRQEPSKQDGESEHEAEDNKKAVIDNEPLASLQLEQIATHQKRLENLISYCRTNEFISKNQGQHLTSRNASELVKSSRYQDNRLAGDAAYEIFLTHGANLDLQIAQYFYTRSLRLTKEQLTGKIAPPPAKSKAAARELLLERKNYLEQALRVINADFKNGETANGR